MQFWYESVYERLSQRRAGFHEKGFKILVIWQHFGQFWPYFQSLRVLRNSYFELPWLKF